MAWAERSYRLSQRRACRAVEAARSTVQYIAVRPPQDALRARLRELVGVRVSYGYPRLTILLRREGWHVNKKRVYRLYREEGLSLRIKRPRRHRTAVARAKTVNPIEPNQVWAMDFMHDVLSSGRRYRIFNVIDVRSRECLVCESDTSLPSRRVIRLLDEIGLDRGYPERIVDHAEERLEALARLEAARP